MSYYHTLIKTKNDNSWVCVFIDLSRSELIKRFVNPYKLGKQIFWDGNITSTVEFKKVKIIRSERPHSEELNILQKKSHEGIEEFNLSGSGAVIISAGYGYNRADIRSSGVDVTSEFIKFGPGTGTAVSTSLKFLSHPWVVRIFAGLAFLIVAAYLGLK